MYIETWYKAACPKCDKPNWICDDFTLPDIEAIECFDCNHKFWFMGEQIDGLEDLYDAAELNLNDAYCVKGKQRPD